MTAAYEFRNRARRAYEWGSIRDGTVKAWPALLLTAVSWWLCHEPGLSLAIGTGLFALATGLFWYGRIGAQAGSARLKAGMAGFALPIPAFYLYCAPFCTLTPLLILNV